MSRIQTYSGRIMDVENPKVSDILVSDIARSLSMLCRFGGHVNKFYSVATHCVSCYTIATLTGCRPETRKWALLHDAAEAYLVDLPRPVKDVLPMYEGLEDTYLRVIAQRFQLSYPIPQFVKNIDRRVLINERNCLVNGSITSVWDPWSHVIPYPSWIWRYNPQSPREAEKSFIKAFTECFLTVTERYNDNDEEKEELPPAYSINRCTYACQHGVQRHT